MLMQKLPFIHNKLSKNVVSLSHSLSAPQQDRCGGRSCNRSNEQAVRVLVFNHQLKTVGALKKKKEALQHVLKPPGTSPHIQQHVFLTGDGKREGFSSLISDSPKTLQAQQAGEERVNHQGSQHDWGMALVI